MIRIPRKIRGFDGVGWNNRAQVRLAGGPMYHEIALRTNAVDDDIQQVTITVNGDVRYQLPGWALRMLEKLKKKYEEAGLLIISLADLSMYSLEGQVMSGLNTVPTDNILVEVKFGDGTASVANPLITPPTLVATATVSNSAPDSPIAMFVPRTRLVNLKGGGAGLVTIDNLHQNANGREMIRRVHFDGRDGGANDYITDLEIRVDDVIRWEQSTADMRYELKRNDLAPQTGFYHFDPLRTRFVSEIFNTAHQKALEFRLQISNAMATVPAIVETLERVG